MNTLSNIALQLEKLKEIEIEMGKIYSEVSNNLNSLNNGGEKESINESQTINNLSDNSLNQKKIKRAIILAAGIGNRLKPLTTYIPKPLTEINGISILKNMLSNLEKNNITEVVIVLGYLANRIRESIGNAFNSIKIIYVENKVYDKTNNIYSLWLAKDYLNEDVLLLEGDVFCEERIIKLLLENENENAMAIDHFMPLFNGFVVSVDSKNIITGMYLKENQKPYRDFNYTDKFKTLNLSKLSKEFLKDYVEYLNIIINEGKVDIFYEKVIKLMFDGGRAKFGGVLVKGYKWFEIDTLDELKSAEEVFSW